MFSKIVLNIFVCSMDVICANISEMIHCWTFQPEFIWQSFKRYKLLPILSVFVVLNGIIILFYAKCLMGIVRLFSFKLPLSLLLLLRLPFQWCYQSDLECNSILLQMKKYVNIICCLFFYYARSFCDNIVRTTCCEHTEQQLLDVTHVFVSNCLRSPLDICAVDNLIRNKFYEFSYFSVAFY